MADLFNALTGYSRQETYRKLLVAPVTMRQQLLARIACEAERQRQHSDGYLAFKQTEESKIFTPKPEEVARAEQIVRAFADNADAGVLAIGGHMVDRAHVKGAERILARVKIVGV